MAGNAVVSELGRDPQGKTLVKGVGQDLKEDTGSTKGPPRGWGFPWEDCVCHP